jgi:hypothetical protein
LSCCGSGTPGLGDDDLTRALQVSIGSAVFVSECGLEFELVR